MSERITSSAAALIFTSFCVVALPPWPPFGRNITNLGDMSVDLAFMLAGPTLMHQRAQWGPDVVFTYGPLELLASSPLYPAQIAPLLTFRLLFAVATAALLCVIVWRSLQHWIERLLAIALFGVNAYLWFIGWDEALWIAPAVSIGILQLTAVEDRPFPINALVYFATSLLGAAALVKFSLTAIYLGIFGILALQDILQRRVPGLSLWFGASVLAAWLLAGQKLANFPTWFASSIDLSRGYSDAMSKGFWIPYSPAVVTLMYAAAALLVLAPLLSRLERSSKILLCTMGAGIAAVNIQHSFGGNQIEQSAMVLIIAALLFGVATAGYARLAAVLCVVACSAVLSVTSFSALDFRRGPLLIQSHIEHLKRALLGRYDFEMLGMQTFNANVRKLTDLPDNISGTADIYPHKAGIIIAYPHLVYHPRPAFLSLNAHTEQLSRQNAEFLRKPDAPEWLLFEIDSAERVNNRYPATDDGPSWPEIWARYSFEMKRNGLLVYHRKTEPDRIVISPVNRANVSFGEPIPIDPSEMVWATIDLKRSWLGNVVSLFYKAPQVMVDLKYLDGSRASYQIVPALGRSGFLLSPTIDTTSGFASRSGKIAKSVALRIEGGNSWAYQPQSEVTLSALAIKDDSKGMTRGSP
ncbi:hypothetical protein [Bradyrhizobium sp. WSM1253]|uniref:hypothetical protein n=1 Tax=Bradyrhizobium sp. WSM1253 TaxID=319003 RepID=UPI0002E1BC08|nr:hypothetical protein [Bradyrhizobium sp. WSM1253]